MLDEFVIAQLGEPVLKAKAVEVTDFGSELEIFVDKLLASMIKAAGIGIAAPQVFDRRRIMIIASRPNNRYPNAPEMDPLVMINPVIEALYGEVVSDWEGCLSVPGIRGFVPRHNGVDVCYQDIVGNSHKISFSGFVARVFQHEFDHLEGKTFVEAVTDNRHLIAESLLPKVLSGEIPFLA